MKEERRSTYVVDLPQVKFPNLKRIAGIELVVSTSNRGAVSNTIARKLEEGITRKTKDKTIRDAMKCLNGKYGDAGNCAYEIHEYFEEDGSPISSSSSKYREIQQLFLADAIAKKYGKAVSSEDMNKANKYIDFYNKQKDNQ